MPLESCMLVLDNSEYMRNGDYAPTRFQAQAQAVSTVFTAKTDSNPESAVGLMTMAGKAPQLLVTPTNDIGKLLSALNKSQIGGLPQLSTAVQVAQLALKHRENKNQRQRIVVFVGSPLEDTQESLVKLGKRLRKNNVLVDVVTFGEEGMGNDEKLGALVEAAGAGDSHLVSIPPGLSLLSDAIISSPILFDPELANIGQGGSGEAGGSGGVGGGDMLAELENTDPELAMAIRMSLQEAEQAAARSAPAADAAPAADTPAQAGPSTAEPTAAAALPATMTQPISNANDPAVPTASGDVPPEQQPLLGDDAQMDEDEEDEDEDEMLRRAMALSRGEDAGEDVMMGDEEEDEDEAIARAIALSMEQDKGPEGEGEEKK